MIRISDKRLNKLDNKKYRHEFMKEMVVGWVVHQLQVLREERSLTQTDLGSLCGKPQSTIGRMESLEYGKWNISTLLEIAGALDVALEVRFVDWPTFINGIDDLSIENMRVKSWSRDQFHPSSKGHGLETSSRNEVRLLSEYSGMELREQILMEIKKASPTPLQSRSRNSFRQAA